MSLDLLPRIQSMLTNPDEAIATSNSGKIDVKPDMLLALAAWYGLSQAWSELGWRPRTSFEAAFDSLLCDIQGLPLESKAA